LCHLDTLSAGDIDTAQTAVVRRPSTPAPRRPTVGRMLPVAQFGRTGHASTRVIFGGAALFSMSQARADEALELITERGVNHIDTAASYGVSEDRLRPWLATHRRNVFLATKTGERTGAAARAELERSLERMAVEQVDLIQLHNLVEPDEWDTAFAPGGAVSALASARDEGLVRFIGVTGHGLRIAEMHRRSLERFDFDSVLLPYSYSMMQIDSYRADFEALRALCAERDVAVQTIKGIARRRWPDEDAPHRSWYEPLTDPGAIGRAVRFVLSQPDLFLSLTSDTTLHRAVLDAAAGSLDRPTDDELAADHHAYDIAPLFDGDALERI
jgi:predicted aldo/keto reductase-like oxidoreductase